MSDQLLVFMKLPRKGYVKSRLGKSIGAEMATHLYAQSMSLTLQSASRSKKPWKICLASKKGLKEHAVWIPWSVSLDLQKGAGLGDRMAHAFESAFDEGRSRVVIVGTDCPSLNSKRIRQAFSSLTRKDLVLGPSRDGGYYLIGLKRSFFNSNPTLIKKRLFSNIPWSSPRVLKTTLKRVLSLSRRITLLRRERDFDERSDLTSGLLEALYPVC
jgi:uncharacterized protein